MGDWLIMHGVPKDSMDDLKTSAMPVRAFVDPVEPDEVVWGGEQLDIGRFDFEVWWTPGHSPGHICFLERGKKFILTGDHVLPTITPNISLHAQQQGNPLGDYIASLEAARGSRRRPRAARARVQLPGPARRACAASSSTTTSASTRCSSVSAAAPARRSMSPDA